MSKFKTLLNNANWEDFYNTGDENKALSIFYKLYNIAFSESFPLKKTLTEAIKGQKMDHQGTNKKYLS